MLDRGFRGPETSSSASTAGAHTSSSATSHAATQFTQSTYVPIAADIPPTVPTLPSPPQGGALQPKTEVASTTIDAEFTPSEVPAPPSPPQGGTEPSPPQGGTEESVPSPPQGGTESLASSPPQGGTTPAYPKRGHHEIDFAAHFASELSVPRPADTLPASSSTELPSAPQGALAKVEAMTPIAKRPKMEAVPKTEIVPTEVQTVVGTAISLPDGIRLCLIGGIPGSGVHSISSAIKNRLDYYGIPVDQINADSFHEPTGPNVCHICKEAAHALNMPDASWLRECWHSPLCLQEPPLFARINRAAVALSQTVAFMTTGLGVIIVQGVHVGVSKVLRMIEQSLRFHLSLFDRDICIARRLSKGESGPGTVGGIDPNDILENQGQKLHDSLRPFMAEKRLGVIP